MQQSGAASLADRRPMLDRARDQLRRVWGYRELRGLQPEVIDAVASGRDALVLMPTGGGKSLCYQLPALLRDGTAVVVSPLIALMADQVTALNDLGVAAAYLNSSQPPEARASVMRELQGGRLDLLYVAPERLLSPGFLDRLATLRLALFAIDEAHCVSQWGHDFRPEYTALNVLAKRFPGVPRVALTATADEVTRREMQERLAMEGADWFVAGFDRPNIRYTVVDKADAKRQFLAFYRAKHEGAAGIVYCLSRKSVDATAKALSREGIDAVPYHAGLNAETRARHQARFLQNEGVVVVATIAFGMGIDKPDVRFVAHLDLPKTLEGYYQETGRAGRDGAPADAFMTYGLQDVMQVRRMLEEGDAPESHRRVMRGRLEALLAYCETAACRREALLRYFGEAYQGPCGNCDVCLAPVRTIDGTVPAQMLLSAVVRTGQRFGVAHLVDVLRGKRTPRVTALGHDALSVFGVGEEHSERSWRSVARQLVAGGQLRPDPAGHGGLRLGPDAAPVLRGERQVRLREDRSGKQTLTRPRRRPADALPPAVQARFEELRRLRSEIAKEQGVPPYVVFHDATLREMAERTPTEPVALRTVSGVGEGKLAKYGSRFLTLLRDLAPAAGAADGEAKAFAGDTVDATRALILEGYAPEAVASVRGLKLRTVEGHVAELVRRGDLTVPEATGLDGDALRAVEDAHDALPDDLRGRLRPLHEALGGRIGYGALRAVLAARDDGR